MQARAHATQPDELSDPGPPSRRGCPRCQQRTEHAPINAAQCGVCTEPNKIQAHTHQHTQAHVLGARPGLALPLNWHGKGAQANALAKLVTQEHKLAFCLHWRITDN